MSVHLEVKGLEELRRKLDNRRLRLAMSEALRENAKRVEDDYKRVTKTWEHKVTIEKIIDTSGDQMEMLVGTDDKIFGWLDKGVKGHWVEPKRAKALAWRASTPKTTPGSIFSGRGRSFGPMIFSKGHWWPGIKPRRFTEVIQGRLNKYGPRIIAKHVRRWIERG